MMVLVVTIFRRERHLGRVKKNIIYNAKVDYSLTTNMSLRPGAAQIQLKFYPNKIYISQRFKP